MPQTPDPDVSSTAISSAEEDALLIARISSGDQEQEAYAALVEKYWKVVVGWVIPRVRDREEAEEVAQEAFIKAFRSLDRLESPRSFLAWLLKIATNCSRDHLRSRKPVVSLDELTESGHEAGMDSGTDDRPEDRLETREDFDRALEAIEKIPARYRLVLTLRYQVGLAPGEIARVLEEPEGTIRNRIFRALAKVRGRLGLEEKKSTRRSAPRNSRSLSFSTPETETRVPNPNSLP